MASSNDRPLFFSDSEEEEAQAAPIANKPKVDEDASSDLLILSTPPKAFKKRPAKTALPQTKPVKRLKAESSAKAATTSKDAKRLIPLDEDGEPLADWTHKYLGSFPGTGWLTTSSKFLKLKDGDRVSFEYEKIRPDPKKKGKEKVNLLIIFRNEKGFECGRLVKEQASFVSKLMDFDVVQLTGQIVSIPKKFESGLFLLICEVRAQMTGRHRLHPLDPRQHPYLCLCVPPRSQQTDRVKPGTQNQRKGKGQLPVRASRNGNGTALQSTQGFSQPPL